MDARWREGTKNLSPLLFTFNEKERTMKIRLIENPTVEVKGDAAVVIFPSRPYWFSATKEIAVVLEVLREEIEEEDAAKMIARNLTVSFEESMETFEEIRDLLYENRVLEVNGKISEEVMEVAPDFQVNATENVLVIAATQGCNLKCRHCYANARKALYNEMTTSDLKSLIKDLASMPWKNDVSRVGLTGGEFFTRPDALEIIDFVHAQGFRVLISSNGLLLTDEMIDGLADYANLKISVSLDGPVAEVHEKIRGKNTFDRTVRAISKLTAREIFVGVNMFVHQGNIHCIEETLQLADKLGVKAFNCLNMMMVGRANSKRSQDELMRVPEHVLYRRLFAILRQNSQYQKMMRNSTFANQIMGIAGGIKSHYCGIGTNRALYVRADGSIYPCPDTAMPQFRLGNVRDKQLFDIWENSLLLQELRQLDVDSMNPICAQCDVRYFCGGGCRGENYQVTRELRSPHFNCGENRATIIEMMWMLTEEPTFFQDKVEGLYQAVCF